MGASTNNTVTLTFSVNIAPYAEGLKSMLSMTQVTGAQIKPLLNFEVKKADFSGIEKMLDSYAKKVKELIPSQDELAGATDALGNANDNEAEKVKRSGKSHEEKALSLNKMKRSSLEAFGVIAFLTQNIVGLAAANSGGNKEMEKLNQGLSQGISAGFGLAGILTALGIATGGVSVAIGAVVTIGVALLSFLDDASEKAEINSKRQSEFARTLQGMTIPQLDEYAKSIGVAIDENEKLIESEKKKLELQEGTVSGGMNLFNMFQRLVGITNTTREAEESLQQKQMEGSEIASKLQEQQKQFAEIKAFIRESEIASVSNQYERQRKEAEYNYEKERDAFVGSKEAQTAAYNKYQAKIREINAAEKTAATQKAKEITEAEKREYDKRRQVYEQHMKSIDQMAALDLTGTLLRLKQRGIKEGKSEEQIALDQTVRMQEANRTQLKLYVERAAELQKIGKKLNDEEQLEKAKLENEKTRLEIDGANQRKDIQESEAEHAKKKIDDILDKYRVYIDMVSSIYSDLLNDIIRRNEQISELEIERFRVDQEMQKASFKKQKEDLQKQLNEKEISYEDYQLSLKDVELRIREEQQKTLDFEKQLNEERVNIFDSAWKAIERSAMRALENIAAKQIEILAAGISGGDNVGKNLLGIGLTAVGTAVGGPIGGLLGSIIGGLFGNGGEVKGVGGPKDDNIIIGASAGEFVVNERAYKNNKGLVNIINSLGTEKPITYMDAMPSVRSEYFTSLAAGGRRVSAPGDGINGTGNVVNIYNNVTIPIEHFNADDEDFKRLKSTVEGAMQQTNSKDVNDLFKNPKRQSIEQK